MTFQKTKYLFFVSAFIFGLFILPVKILAVDQNIHSLEMSTTSSAEATNSPSMSNLEETKTSYELFWPIAAGRVEGDSLYFLKTFKEWIIDKLTFGKVKNAEYHLTLSKKRLVETEKLIQEDNIPMAEKTIGRSADELSKAVQKMKTAKEQGMNVAELTGMIGSDGEKEVNFLKTMVSKLSQDNQKSVFETTADKMNSLLSF